MGTRYAEAMATIPHKHNVMLAHLRRMNEFSNVA